MKLKIVVAHKLLVEEEISRLVADGANGSFGILPRHIDTVNLLPIGILAYHTTGNETWYVAHDEGVLVKQGKDVHVATRRAERSRDMTELQDAVRKKLLDQDDREKKSRSVLAMLEGGIIRKLREQISIEIES